MNTNQFMDSFIQSVSNKHSDKLVGKPTMSHHEFSFKPTAVKLPKFETSNMVTVNPIKTRIA